MNDYRDYEDEENLVAPPVEDFEPAPAADTTPQPREVSKQPLFQTLFAEIVEPGDTVLADFAEYVVGPLSEHFAVSAAKGGAFFCEKEAAGAKNTYRYSFDQSLRAHLINGMLPARNVAHLLKQWGAPKFDRWNDVVERLFIAGYMLHDFTKIEGVKETLKAAGFKEMEAPSVRQIPTLEGIFRDWCARLGLDAFLQPIGGVDEYLHSLIFIACNTQRNNGTIHAPSLLPNVHPDVDVYELATEISRLADLVAYIARTPRDLVAHDTVSKLLKSLSFNRKTEEIQARLVYHHVAENRGLLLNLIHNAVLQALEVDGRVPLLYAPSGVVYLERNDAPPLPALDTLIPQIVTYVRQTAGKQLIATGKAARRGNVNFQIDESYNDYFDLPSLIYQSSRLIAKHIVNNKSEARLAPVRDNGWASSNNIPTLPQDKRDARVDQIAEWAGFLEVQLRDRLGDFDLATWLLTHLGIGDLLSDFRALENDPGARKGGGIKFWWFWAAAHALDRQPKDTQATLDWITALSEELAAALPADLPDSALADETKWNDLANYLSRVLTLGGAKAALAVAHDELARYTNAKGKRSGAVCAICGEAYTTSKPKETVVAFQPGVYTARVKLNASSNTRSLCSLCSLEQLLRQLFLFTGERDYGGDIEGQRVRYLSFYPTYFFTPETMRLMQRVYNRFTDVRLSEKNLRRAISEANLTDPSFWQRLDEFLLRPFNGEPSKRVLRYTPEAQATFFMAGLREFNAGTDTESWILPSLFALVLPICLDVKVVAGESSTPLLLEADELPETVWLEGAHSAITDLLTTSRLRIHEVMPALARLAAAYMIHLDTEYTPPKEHFNRFAPIAHALMESPLYVFYFLKQQERDDHPVGIERVRRYIDYAETLFSPEGDQSMFHSKYLVETYRQFYRAKPRSGKLNTNSILRPIDVAADTLATITPEVFDDDDELVAIVRGRLEDFLERINKNNADGQIPHWINPEIRQQAQRDFCEYFVREFFINRLKRDVAGLRGKQINLLRSACEALYKDAQYAEWAERNRNGATDDETQDA